jgi:hypothetical protein
MQDKSLSKHLIVIRVLAIVGVLFASISALADQAPRLLVESAVYNFGTVRQGDKISTAFKIKNGGQGELLIQRVVAACGCTASNPSKERLEPGESAEIQVVFDTSGFVGEKLKTVRVFSNDPVQPSALLTVQGVIEPDIIVEPARLIFPEIVRGEAAKGASQEFSLKVRSGAASRLGTPTSSSASFSVTELPGATETSKRIQVTADPTLAPGEYRERIIVPVTDGNTSAIIVPVIVTVKGTLELRPVSLSFGVLEGQAPIEKVVRVQNLSTSPVAIESVTSDNIAVTATVRARQPSGSAAAGSDGARERKSNSRQQEVVVVVDPGKVTSDLRANVTIKTSRKSEPDLVLGVYGIKPIS